MNVDTNMFLSLVCCWAYCFRSSYEYLSKMTKTSVWGLSVEGGVEYGAGADLNMMIMKGPATYLTYLSRSR